MSYLPPPPPADGFNPTGSPLAPRPVSFGEAISRFYANYANFKGRASRSEYWFISLYSLIVGLPLQFLAISNGNVDPGTGISQPNLMYLGIGFIFSLVNFVPSIALAVRRLHDTNKRGTYIFFALIPCVGAIMLLIAFLSEGDRNENQFGPAS